MGVEVLVSMEIKDLKVRMVFVSIIFLAKLKVVVVFVEIVVN